MRISGTLNRIGDIKRITNLQTGKIYVKRDITVIVKEQYYTKSGEHRIQDNEMLFTLIFDTAENFSIEKGQQVIILYNSTVSESTYFYETKTVRSINFAN